MLRPVIFLQLALWVATISAFYPWIPPPLRVKHLAHGESGSESQTDRRASSVPGVTTLKVTQRNSVAKADTPDNAVLEASRLLRKYGGSRPSRTVGQRPGLAKRKNEFSVVEPKSPTGTNAVGIFQDGTDFSYFVEAKIGSGETPLYMLLDTGAGTTWVTGSDCQSSACKIHNSYTISDSDSSEGGSEGFKIAYGSGSVEGSLVKDSVSLADLKAPMTFGVANVTSNDFNHFPFDGILGLSMSTGATDNYLQILKDSGAIKSDLFAVVLSRNSDGPNTGEISFGATNPSKFTGDISYSDLAPKADDSWAISMDDMSYDGNSAGLKGRLAYIDSGTSYAFGPKDDVAALHKLIPGSETSDGVVYTVPCDTDVPIKASFSGVDYTISAEDWHLSSSGGDSKCTSNIYGHPVIEDAWLLGDMFLKNVYAVFDAGQKRIGFASRPAPSSDSGSPSPTSGAPSSSSSGANIPGLSGHETSVTGVSPTETGGGSATHTSSSWTTRSEMNVCTPFLALVAMIYMTA